MPTVPLSEVPTSSTSTYKTMQQTQSTIHQYTVSLAIATTATVGTSPTPSSIFTAVSNMVKKKQKRPALTANEVSGYVLYIGLTLVLLSLPISYALRKCLRTSCIPSEQTMPLLNTKEDTGHSDEDTSEIHITTNPLKAYYSKCSLSKQGRKPQPQRAGQYCISVTYVSFSSRCALL